MIFDTHAHYNSEQFDADRDELLSKMNEGGVGLIMNACSNLDEIPDIIALCDRYPFIFGAVGIHPEEVDGLSADYLDRLRRSSAHPKIRAIGEIGLDYYWTTETKAEQQRILGEQVDLARELKLPVIIHDREAHGDTMRILREHKVWECGGVFHCYSGSAEMVREITDELNMYIGFGGALTFKNAKKPRMAAEAVPLNRLLIETDCPYMAPVPYRGKRNSSLYLPEVIELLAEIKGLPAEEIERITEENGRRLFGI
ncbi:MAG: TatD family hydrolase [Clostridia bacterium]|nr:TatD family hydrolase [Clostridia bacterium]